MSSTDEPKPYVMKYVGDNTVAYVAGFAVKNGIVALVDKRRGPPSVVGRLNGVGGKVEKGEDALDAMVREFAEEAGVETTREQWKYTISLHGVGWVVYFFVTEHVDPMETKTMTDEVIVPVALEDLWSVNVVPNLLWILPMFLDRDLTFPIHIEEWKRYVDP